MKTKYYSHIPVYIYFDLNLFEMSFKYSFILKSNFKIL